MKSRYLVLVFLLMAAALFQNLKPGGLYRFVIPPELAYGARGSGKILGDSTLTFEVELISIEKP